MSAMSPTAVPAATGVVVMSTGDVRIPVYRAAEPAAPRLADQPYRPPTGTDELRAAIAARMARLHAAEVGADDVVVTPGARIAILAALKAVIRPERREVLLPAPYWASYPWLIEAAGGVPVRMAGRPGHPGLDATVLDAYASDRTAVVVANSPRNPDGAVAGADTLRGLLDWAVRRDVVVVADEVYGAVPVGSVPPSVLDLAATVSEHCIVVNGLSKSHALAGLRIGWAVARPRWSMAIGAVCSHLVGSTCTAAQATAALILADGDGTREVLRNVLHRNLEATLTALASVPGVDCARPAGGIFVLPDLREWLAGPAPEQAREDPIGWLRDRHGVQVVDGAPFGAPGYVRLSFALPIDELTDGLRRLRQALATRVGHDRR